MQSLPLWYLRTQNWPQSKCCMQSADGLDFIMSLLSRPFSKALAKTRSPKVSGIFIGIVEWVNSSRAETYSLRHFSIVCSYTAEGLTLSFGPSLRLWLLANILWIINQYFLRVKKYSMPWRFFSPGVLGIGKKRFFLLSFRYRARMRNWQRTRCRIGIYVSFRSFVQAPRVICHAG